MSYEYVGGKSNPGVRWKNGTIHRGPHAKSAAFKDAIADLNSEADAAGYTGAEGHFRYHNRKQLETE